MKHRSFLFSLLLALGALAGTSTPAAAQDRLCDPANEDCRAILINYIRSETVGIDVGFWFMEDARYTAELIRKHQAGVKVRVLMDPRANSTYDLNDDRLAELQNAGIPMRKRLTSYILHWKMMLFRGQGVVEFSGANYSADALVYDMTDGPYANYVDEAIFFARDLGIVNSFREKFDDFWTDTTNWTNYANVSGALTRYAPDGTFAQDSQMNFPPDQNYRSRAVSRYNAARTATNGRGVDTIMYRITDRAHSDAMINLEARGVPVRLITEQDQYRLVSRMWHAWNVDRMYMAGVQVRDRQHAGLNHQKSVIIYDQDTAAGDQTMVIFGSSNWTSPSASGQVEHNMFTTRTDLTSWFVDQFNRKWDNLASSPETKAFAPLPPDTPINPLPANGATAIATAATLGWLGGPWAHLYDVYISSDFNAVNTFSAAALAPGGVADDNTKKTATSRSQLAVTLQPGTTYYWRIVSKTMALKPKNGPVWSFTTAGTAPPPPPTGSAEIVLYAGKAPVRVGAWQVESDATAAGGLKIRNPNNNAAKITTASAQPASYFEMTFQAEAGVGYHLWVRGRADANNWANDSVFVQFNNSVTSSGSPTGRIGTTSSNEVNLENCNGCGVAGWGWQDNAYGNNVPGTLIYFATSGPQTIRVQPREDGLAIDQIVLSHTVYVSTSPGALKNDTQILAEADGSGDPPPPPPPPDGGNVVLYAAEASTRSGGWIVEADSTAAGSSKLRHPNAGAAKLAAALASPTSYFEMTFNAEAGKPYRIWIRGKADSNSWANDSLFIQFNGSVNASGTPIWRIGTTAATDYNLEDCSGCGLANWGWQDNGWGVGVMGPLVYFAATGPQTIRIQTREDGLSVDQILLASETYLSSPPGVLKNDNTILQKTP
jgi:phosphatidylserine/phosphatidylglycerophosphate/cardiolipin synthase-like enzyme